MVELGAIPKSGDIVVTGSQKRAVIRRFGKQKKVIGVVRQVIRALKDPNHAEPDRLKEILTELEQVPENEGERFRLESDIYRLEREDTDEWPDVIEG